MKYVISTLVILAASMSHAALAPYQKTMANGKTVTFVKEASMTPEQFSKAPYNLKPDPALLQNQYALKDSEKAAITAADIQKMTQEEIDQLYIRLESGPILPGSYEGKIVQKIEMVGDIKKDVYSKIAGKYQMLGPVLRMICKERDPVECLGEMVWKGKRIYQPNAEGEYLLRNALNRATVDVVHGAIAPALTSLKAVDYSGTDLIGLTDQASAVEEYFPEEGSFLTVPNPTKWKSKMMFPAHVYCGQSLFDHRRESIIIDYAWGRDFKPFVEPVDVLAGPGFLNIRDEIRMVRPGLYVGRAYTNKIFLLNFVLTNYEKNIGAMPNTCYDGKNIR